MEWLIVPLPETGSMAKKPFGGKFMSPVLGQGTQVEIRKTGYLVLAQRRALA